MKVFGLTIACLLAGTLPLSCAILPERDKSPKTPAATLAVASAETSIPTAIDTMVRLIPLPNQHGWHRVPVTLSTDHLTGLKCPPAQVVIRPGSYSNLQVSCQDSSGQPVDVPVPAFAIDTTPPVVVLAPSSYPNEAGWIGSALMVRVKGIDEESGIKGCDSGLMLTQGKDLSVTRTCEDFAGNVGTATLENINIDATAPGIQAIYGRQPNRAGWHNRPFIVYFRGQDEHSGVASCTAPVPMLSEGQGMSIPGTCTDRSGNTMSASTGFINLDLTPPIVKCTIKQLGPVSGTPPMRELVLEVHVEDALSGPGHFVLEHLLSGDKPPSERVARQWVPGSPDVMGLISEEAVTEQNPLRFHYIGFDIAGNGARCTVVLESTAGD